MTGSTADDIVKAIQGVLLDFGLDIQKMVSFSSDGCNTMRGTENGVLIKLTRLINISIHPQRPDDVDDKCLFAPHCVLHRLNLSLNDIFLSESTPVTVCQLADRIELIVKYCHSWFARSSERRLEYKNLIKEHTVVEIPASWNETRWLSRYRALKATCDSNSAILQFIEENAKVKQSPEGLFVAKWMSDPDFMTEMKMMRSVVKVMFKLSIILQASVQSPWEAFLLIQIGVGRLTELLDEVEETKSAEAVRLLIRTARKSINERIPQSEAKMLAIFDFRVLKHMVAKARIAQESAAGVHLRGEQDDFEDPEDVIFDQGLVIKSLRSHALAFQRLYVDFQSEGQEISVDELVKKLVKAFNRLQRNAALRSIFDIYAIADVVLVADDEVNKVGRRLVKIIGCFSADSVIAERGFSQLARIRTKLRNCLKTRNLNASMSLRLNPLPSLESVLTRWRSEKERRKKVVRPQQERNLYAM